MLEQNLLQFRCQFLFSITCLAHVTHRNKPNIQVEYQWLAAHWRQTLKQFWAVICTSVATTGICGAQHETKKQQFQCQFLFSVTCLAQVTHRNKPNIQVEYQRLAAHWRQTLKQFWAVICTSVATMGIRGAQHETKKQQFWCQFLFSVTCLAHVTHRNKPNVQVEYQRLAAHWRQTLKQYWAVICTTVATRGIRGAQHETKYCSAQM